MTDIKVNLEGIAPYILNELNSGNYELPERTMCAKYLTNDDRVLELGSAIGYVAIATMKHHRKINWTAIEANPWCVKRSQENCRKNEVSPVILNGIATLGVKDPIEFYVREEFWNSSMDPIDLPYSKIVETITCNTYSINDLLKNRNVLVMDIEGGETEFFKENGIDLTNVDKLVIEFHPAFTGKEFVRYAENYIKKTHRLVDAMSNPNTIHIDEESAGNVHFYERIKG